MGEIIFSHGYMFVNLTDGVPSLFLGPHNNSVNVCPSFYPECSLPPALCLLCSRLTELPQWLISSGIINAPPPNYDRTHRFDSPYTPLLEQTGAMTEFACSGCEVSDASFVPQHAQTLAPGSRGGVTAYTFFQVFLACTVLPAGSPLSSGGSPLN